MAKSLRSKREKRLRTLRREIAEPFHEVKEVAKFAAAEAALAAPKLPVKVYKNSNNTTTTSMEIASTMDRPTSRATKPQRQFLLPIPSTDVEMGDVEASEVKNSSALKAVGGIGKKMKKKFKVGRGRNQGKSNGKTRRKHKI